MNRLKYYCFFIAFICWAGAASNIQSFDGTVGHGDTSEFVVSHFENEYERIYAFVIGFIFSSFAYGVHKRYPIVWMLGWPLLIGNYFSFVAAAIMGLNKASQVVDFSSFWLPVILVVVLGVVNPRY